MITTGSGTSRVTADEETSIKITERHGPGRPGVSSFRTRGIDIFGQVRCLSTFTVGGGPYK